jgi:hypothetical protein
MPTVEEWLKIAFSKIIKLLIGPGNALFVLRSESSGSPWLLAIASRPNLPELRASSTDLYIRASQ